MATETAPLKLFSPVATDATLLTSSGEQTLASRAKTPSNFETVDDIIERMGIGRFHYIAAIVCGLGNASDAVELLCVSFILPAFASDIGEGGKGALSAAVFVGMLIGGCIAGTASDRFGRRPMLALSLGVNALFGFLSILSPTWHVLAALRVIAGVGVGGSIPGVFSLFTEFLPSQRRGFFISLIAAWWMIGQIFTAAMAWLIIGYLDGNWRIFAAICSIPASVACFLTLWLLPESPRFRYSKHQFQGCADSLNYMAKLSGKAVWTSQSSEAQWVADVAAARGNNKIQVTNRKNTVRRVLDALKAQVVDFLHPSIRRTSVLLLIVWFCLSFGWYGLVLWIPTLFEEVHLEIDPYQDSFIVTAANLPGNIAAALLMDRIGRKWTMVGSLIGACASAILFAFATNKAVVLIAACLLNAISVGSWNSLDCLSTESFPTSLRTSAMGFLAASGRIGSIVGQFVFGAMVTVSIPALLTTAAAILGVGALSSWMLPQETANMHLADFLAGKEDANKQPKEGAEDPIDLASVVEMPQAQLSP